MNTDILISTAGSVIVAIVALVVNTFWINRSLNNIDHRLDLIESDLKQIKQKIIT